MKSSVWMTGAGLIVSSAGCAVFQQQDARIMAELQTTKVDRGADELMADTQANLGKAAELRTRILSVTGPRTLENTLLPANEMAMLIDASYNESGLLANVHPNETVRTAAEECERMAVQRITELSLDRDLYEAYKAVDVSGADPATQFMMFRVLRDFRMAGVDKSDEVRAKVRALQDEIVTLGQEFGRITRDDVREILLNSQADLDGLPADYLASHAPAADGKIHISTDYPDYIPFMSYARNGQARLDLYKVYKDRGYPGNIEVLNKLIAKRHELASLLGHSSWADYVMQDKMIGSAANAAAFIDKIAASAKPAVDRDYRILLERKRKDDPKAEKVGDWEKSYYIELIKNEKYNFDSKEVRSYFEFSKVQQGLFDITGRLFGIDYRPVTGVKTWHEDVTVWDVYEGPTLLGRFYLDLHPREGKYKHAACFGFRSGVFGRRLPQSALVCNFPDPKKSEGPALMDHDEVQTFFHEFGHLIHAILGGHQKWVGISGISTEHDFVEAPSQMLEEWIWDAPTLQLFARHHESGRPIPTDLVKRMKEAGDFGKGLDAAHQMFYAAVSLHYYNADPANLDTTQKMKELQQKYSAFEYVDGTHFQCNFGHLDGYSAVYYTYMWSLVIAKDLFSEFEKSGLLNTRTAVKYRRSILEPGGSKKAADLVKDFLGREYSFDAYNTWLNRG